MTLVVNRPRALASSFDQLFNEFFRNDFPLANGDGHRAMQVPVNLIESAEGFRLELAIPGLEKNDFEIDLDKDELTIKANRERDLAEGETFKRREFGNIEFERRFRLPETVDTDGIEAKYENGMLIVQLPKREEAKVKPARKVEVA